MKKRSRGTKIGNLVAISLIVGVFAIILALSWHNVAVKPTAVIVDPISTTLGDKNFTQNCTNLLEAAGYTVKTYEAEEATVESIRSIRGCTLLILRVHSSVFNDGVWFFTGEPYSTTRYVPEQLSNDLHVGRTPLMEGLTFAVGASFINRNLRNGLQGALVVLMGCDGLRRLDLAEAFIDAGAAAYVGWDGPITIQQTDEATISLLRGLVKEGASLQEGIDFFPPSVVDGFNSTLRYHPADAGNYRLPTRG